MKIALVGKTGSITHWLEHAAAAWRGDGHDVRLAVIRRSWLAAPVEKALAGFIAGRLRAGLRRFQPDLIVAIGAYHTPLPLLQAIASLPGRPPLVGWVGDVFATSAAEHARCYDLVGYADSMLMSRHQEWGFSASPMFLPHAVDAHRLPPAGDFRRREARMVFVANPTPGRLAVIRQIRSPVALYGPGWKDADVDAHEIRGARTPARRVPAILAAHQVSLNIRNELNVLAGLNQRNFEPCAAGAAMLTDNQPDLESCFDPGGEVMVWRDVSELNGLHDKLLGDPGFASSIAERGRARVLAQHTYAHRLRALVAALGLASS